MPRLWLINLTNTQIPASVKDTLSLGEKFNFLINPDKRTMFECLKNIEIGTRNIDDINSNIKDDILAVVNNYIKKTKTQHINIDDRTINSNLTLTKKFLKDNPEIFITKADKGNVTVIMKNTEYVEKVETALSDKKHYAVIKKSPLRTLQNTSLETITKSSLTGTEKIRLLVAT